MIIRLSDRTGLEPDVVVVPAEAVTSRTQGSFEAAQVLLAVEVMSPSSVERDRDLKPHLYAAAGIAYYWRVEWETATPIAFTYRLASDGPYQPTGEFIGLLTVTEPYPVDIDLTEADRI